MKNYVAMRALGDPDVFLPTDLGVRDAAARLGIEDVVLRSEGWRPWRSYALLRLWSVVLEGMRPGFEKRDNREASSTNARTET
jgi:AraC family transcriptional regulator of adaptative response / DNA-3-methyladenine glycosylase II